MNSSKNKKAYIKTPVKGMADCLPSDVRIREKVLNIIKENYKKYGFTQIETPCMEHIENLTTNEGGENEKLIFKVLKRGADLQREIEAGTTDFADNALRYDLTVPLSRFYANNIQNLPSPFKALQIGNVWRADNPQKGRFRQFVQCDIDILDDKSSLAEIELITATSKSLCEILKPAKISGLTILINDRRILIACAKQAGFKDDEILSVLISLDKLDKIGLNGVREELLKNGFKEEVVTNYLKFFEDIEGKTCSEFCKNINEGYLGKEVAENLQNIISCVEPLFENGIKIKYEPKLVRGMGYYTGPIFEVILDDYNFAIAAGGRYDNMVGKFCQKEVPAVGFSIGFERIITILKDKSNFDEKIEGESIAILIDENLSNEEKLEIFKEAKKLREEGKIVLIEHMRKNLKKQIGDLENEGYKEFKKVFSK